MNYQEQLSVDLMSKLSIHAEAYRTGGSCYNLFWLDSMDIIFDLAYQEIYGYLPHGC